MKESFGSDLRGQVRQTVKALLEVDSEQRMGEYPGLRWYEGPVEDEERVDSHFGYYERDSTTRWGIIRFRVRRTHLRSFLPRRLRAFQRRAPEVTELIRQAFLRGVATRAVALGVALVTGEAQGHQLQLIITDGCAGLAAALQTVYPALPHNAVG